MVMLATKQPSGRPWSRLAGAGGGQETICRQAAAYQVLTSVVNGMAVDGGAGADEGVTRQAADFFIWR